jgi:tetratricopeptide (TPR) repeat protein
VRIVWRSFALALSLVLLPALAASAQEGSSGAEIAEARALFMAGQAAVESGRWADAVDSFSRAYDLSGVAAALYNLGFALRALGRHHEARDAFNRLLEEHPDFDREKRREARRYRAESADRVVQVSVDGLDDGVRYVIRLDGQPVADDGRRPLLVEGDPGTHTLTVRAPGFSPFLWEGELADGELRTVDVEMAAVSVGGSGTNAGTEHGSGNGSRTGNGSGTDASEGFPGWGWALIITAVVLLAGGALAAYFIYDAAQLDGESNRVYEL